MRWTAAGKGAGRRVSCDMDVVFHFPTDDPEHDPADLGGREVTVQLIVDNNEFNEDRYPPVRRGQLDTAQRSCPSLDLAKLVRGELYPGLEYIVMCWAMLLLLDRRMLQTFFIIGI